MKKEMTRSEFREAYMGYVGKTKYAKGGFGQLLTIAELARLSALYPDWYNKKCPYSGYTHLTWFGYLSLFCDGSWFIADCIGLIKGIRAGYRADGTVGNLTKAIDQTCRQMVAELENKTSDYKHAEADDMVWFSDYSHAMIISERGKKDVESAPSLDGVKQVPLTHQPPERVGGAGRLPWVDYNDVKPEDDEVKYSDFQICRKGSRGDAVKTIQANVGVFVDGDFGANTDRAVREFQRKKGLVVDGIVGEKTWEAIVNKWHK